MTGTSHPGLVAAVRVLLYATATTAVVTLAGVVVGVVGVAAAAWTLSALVVGDAPTVAASVVAGGSLLTAGVGAVALAVATRRVDRAVVRGARGPDPLEEVRARYVAGRIDERGLERELDRVLAARADDRSGQRDVSPPPTARSRDAGPAVRRSGAPPDGAGEPSSQPERRGSRPVEGREK